MRNLLATSLLKATCGSRDAKTPPQTHEESSPIHFPFAAGELPSGVDSVGLLEALYSLCEWYGNFVGDEPPASCPPATGFNIIIDQERKDTGQLSYIPEARLGIRSASTPLSPQVTSQTVSRHFCSGNCCRCFRVLWGFPHMMVQVSKGHYRYGIWDLILSLTEWLDSLRHLGPI